MNVVCPCCQAVFPVDAALEDIAHRDAYTELLELTPFPELLPGYLRLFAPSKRALSGKKKARLTAELVAMVKAARFDYKRVSYVAPLEYWRSGFETLQFMRDSGTLELPLSSHNLLLAVMAKQINKAENRKEYQHENQQAGRTQVGGQALKTVDQVLGKRKDKPGSVMPESVKAVLKKGGSNDAE